jgi:L-ascorbate metabolism protein UlaG (beta-lactamase superfamily)
MRTLLLPLLVLILLVIPVGASAQEPPAEDVIPTSAGPLTIHFIGHGTLMFGFGGKVVHVDPVSAQADYTKLPKADLVLVTHEHGDHLDAKAIEAVRKPGTVVLVSPSCAGRIEGAEVMKNGEARTAAGLKIEAVPAYNLVNKRPDGTPFHPRGNGNGYIIDFGGTRVYVAGDTENTPEMKGLKDVAIAFLPMNLPYTMTPELVADAARAFRPRILYPYHYGNTDPQLLVRLLADAPAIEVRVRNLK